MNAFDFLPFNFVYFFIFLPKLYPWEAGVEVDKSIQNHFIGTRKYSKLFWHEDIDRKFLDYGVINFKNKCRDFEIVKVPTC